MWWYWLSADLFCVVIVTRDANKGHDIRCRKPYYRERWKVVVAEENSIEVISKKEHARHCHRCYVLLTTETDWQPWRTTTVSFRELTMTSHVYWSRRYFVSNLCGNTDSSGSGMLTWRSVVNYVRRSSACSSWYYSNCPVRMGSDAELLYSERRWQRNPRTLGEMTQLCECN